MGKWFERRIEVRDVIVACAVAGCAGGTLSWLVFAWIGTGAEKFPFGSLGDWAAALGTWVIGYGAWKYAREAHALRQSEIRVERAALLEDKFALLNRLRHIIICVQDTMAHFGEAIEDEATPIDSVDFLASCDTCSAYFSAQDWDEVSLMARDPEGLDMLSALRLWARDILKECTEISSFYEGRPLEKTLPRDRLANNLIISIGGIRKVSGEIADYEKKRRDELLAEANSLELIGPLPTEQPGG